MVESHSTGVGQGRRIALIGAEQDAQTLDVLSLELQFLGFDTVRFTNTTTGISVVLVVVSNAAVSDAAWIEHVNAIGGQQLVPIRLDDTDAAAMPTKVADVQWIDYDQERHATFIGELLAVLSLPPDERSALRSLVERTESWAAGGLRPSLLLSEPADVEEASHLRARHTDVLDPRQQTMIDQFLAASRPIAAKNRRRRVRRRLVGAAALLAFAVGAVVTVPAVRRLARASHANLIMAPEQSIDRDLPQWSALIAAAALVDGTASQDDIARSRLVNALTWPGPVSQVRVGAGYGIEAVAPLHVEMKAAVIVRSTADQYYFGVQTWRTGAIEWVIQLDGEYWFADVADDDSVAVVVGGGGAALIDLKMQTVGYLSSERYDRAVLWGDHVSLAAFDGRLADIHLPTGKKLDLGQHGDLTALTPSTNDGRRSGSRAAFVNGQTFLVLDGGSGEQLVSGRLAAATVLASAVPGSETIAVIDEHRRIYTVTGDGDAVATGLRAPLGAREMIGMEGDLVVITSLSEQPRVLHLPTGATLGTTCRSGSQITVIAASQDGRIGCLGNVTAEVWVVPSAPVPEKVAAPSSRSDAHGGTTATVTGAGVRVQSPIGNVDLEPWRGRPVSVAVNEMGTGLLVSTDEGEVFVVTIHDSGTAFWSAWNVPTGAPVVQVQWSGAVAIAYSADGWRWEVPACGDCSSDDALLDRLAERVLHCWSGEQLQWIELDTRRRLGVDDCAADRQVVLP